MNTYLGEAEKAQRNAPQGAESNWPGPQPTRLPHLPLQVDDLKARLAVQEAELKQKNENADKLIHVVGVETEKVSKEKAIADEEEIKVEVINKVGGGQLHSARRLPRVTSISLRALATQQDSCREGTSPKCRAPGSAEGCPPRAPQWHLLSW